MNALERLEERALMTFSTLGYSLPDLTISGEAGPRAAWGGTLDVTVFLQNIGASSTTEPVSQLPVTQQQATGSLYNSTSSADVPASSVEVILSPSAHSFRNAIKLGTFMAPSLSQNNLEVLQEAFNLPNRPAGFPVHGGRFYVRFVANSNDAIQESSYANNVSKPIPVRVTPVGLPELRVANLSIPSNVQPGDTIFPVISIENLGTAPTDLQGPVTVDLVASVTPTFTLGSSIVASYSVSNIPPVSQAPTRGNYKTFASQNLSPPDNVVSIQGNAVTLPTTPGTYYLGVVIDPAHQIKQLKRPHNPFEAFQVVGPAVSHLPATGIGSNATTSQFPSPPTGGTVGTQ